LSESGEDLSDDELEIAMEMINPEESENINLDELADLASLGSECELQIEDCDL
jgi:hypothetical protein